MKGVNLTTKMQQPEEPNGMFGGEVVSCGLWASVLSSTSNTDMWVKKKKENNSNTDAEDKNRADLIVTYLKISKI